MKHQQQSALTQQSQPLRQQEVNHYDITGSRPLQNRRQSTTMKQRAVNLYLSAASQPLWNSSQSLAILCNFSVTAITLLYCTSKMLKRVNITSCAVSEATTPKQYILLAPVQQCQLGPCTATWGRGSKCVLSPGRTTWVPSRGQYGPSHLSSRVNPSPACLLHSLPPPLTSAAPSQISFNPPPPFQLSREYCSIQRRIGTGCISGTHCPAPSPKFTNTPPKMTNKSKL